MRNKTSSELGTITQKILGTHTTGADADGYSSLKVDHVVLARRPERALVALARQEGRANAEVCVVYPPHSFRERSETNGEFDVDAFALKAGFFLMKRGAGYGAPTHLERFSTPGKVVLTDEPRLAALGGVGMLSVMASTPQLVDALCRGETEIRAPLCVQINLSGRLRPFVGARDVTLELVRRGIGETIRELDARTHAPIALEFGGPSAKLLSISERAILCGAAPRLGAAFALFPSDDKTESFLREQKRSKAFRSLFADPGAAYESVTTVDLSGIDPLVEWSDGSITSIHKVEDAPVGVAVFGGDSGTSLRDLLSVATLLKSKRIAPHLDVLLTPPSRQMLEVLARNEYLADLLASGVRLVESDRRLLSGELVEPPKDHIILQTSEPEPYQQTEGRSRPVVASPETIAWSALRGRLGDPRGFKRPQRITVPRNLPTEDVMLSRAEETKGPSRGKGRIDSRSSGANLTPTDLKAPESERTTVRDFSVVRWSTTVRPEFPASNPVAFIASRWEDIGVLADRAAELPGLGVVVATHVPTRDADLLSAQGVLVLRGNEDIVGLLEKASELRVVREDLDSGEVELLVSSETRTFERVGRTPHARR